MFVVISKIMADNFCYLRSKYKLTLVEMSDLSRLSIPKVEAFETVGTEVDSEDFLLYCKALATAPEDIIKPMSNIE